MDLPEARAKAEEWLLRTPLYEEIAGSDPKHCYHAIRALVLRATPFDAYCVECKRAATFIPEHDETKRNLVLRGTEDAIQTYCMGSPVLVVSAACARNGSHRMQFVYLHRFKKGVWKIGQYPSLADLSIPESKQFIKVLGQDRVRELNTAIGLAAHGVGVGSYIYLRRIFESLVEEAHDKARNDGAWDDDAYQRSRMNERVTMLKGYLPAFLVEHPQLYGILSKHVHELSEDECLRNFEAVREAILIIARDKLKAHEEQEHRERTAKLLVKINSTVNGKTGS
ncbi:hypothetical protein C9I57_25435 [Trinickia symbiotica]|uniref:Uncharacterized protein n=1 Tax=Trinickia symbiotica TaxID=863227 RepID=A0A2T3XMW9_9BURK|nr:hypothetical protein [Trinickia symbiotica]PTB17872.1 hypothetical protein C9I57_25435 [Trinickia symbiotica]